MKPKILFILHIPPPINGAALVGQQIKESTLINKSYDANYINLTTSFNLGHIGKFGMGKLFTILKIQLAVLKALLSKNYDLCYMTLTATGPGFYKDLVLVVLLKLFRRNIVYHFHNKGVLGNSRSGFHRMLYRFVFRNTRLILLSPKLYPDVAHIVPEQSVFYCPNGVPDIDEKNIKAKVPDGKETPFRFLFLSNMMIEKGIFVLLEACHLLSKKGLQFECHFVGAWSDLSEKQFNEMVKNKNLEATVFGHGPKYGAEKRAFFYDSHVFVFPTFYHNEAFPLVLLEAMQQGLPIISTSEGGISDIVNDGINGYLVDRRNPEALAYKMQDMLNRPELLEEMGKAGRQKFLEQYTLEAFEHRLFIILKKLI